MSNLNQVTLMGRLTADPELRQTQNGVPYCNFTIAINEPLSREAREEGREPKVNFIDCIAWQRRAENLAQYQQKGNIILVVGKIEKNSYTNQDGERRHSTKVRADNIQFMPKQTNNQEYDAPEDEPDVIPF